MVDPVEQFEHDHGELTRLVVAVKGLLDQEATAPAGARGRLADQVDVLRDDLVAHFSREEEGLFPFVVERLPDLRRVVESVRTGHDTICGALVRLSHAARTSPPADVARLSSLFERFEIAYVSHAREEREMLRELARRLDAQQRRELAELVEGL